MEANYPNSIAILRDVSSKQLYHKLIDQLNKDLRLSGITLELIRDISPEELLSILRETIYRLILEDFPKFVNLLYIADVTEKQVTEAANGDAVEMADRATFLLLKRLWKKVWFREYYK